MLNVAMMHIKLVIRGSNFSARGASTRPTLPRVCATKDYAPSSRRHQVLREHDQEWFWGTKATGSAQPASSSAVSRELRRELEQASGPNDLLELVLQHTRQARRTDGTSGSNTTRGTAAPGAFLGISWLHAALLRGADVLSDEGAIAGLDQDQLTQVVAHLEAQFALACNGSGAAGNQESSQTGMGHAEPADMASMVWCLATIRGVVIVGASSNHSGSSRNGAGNATEHSHLLEVLRGMDQWAAAELRDTTSVLRTDDAVKHHVVVSLLWGYTALWRQYNLEVAQHSSSPRVAVAGPLVDALCARASHMLRELVSGDEWLPADLADFVWALAAVKHKSPSVAQAVEAVAHEVYRQISNRHSLNQPFTTPDVVKALRAFADLNIRDANVSRMMDAIAGFVVKRVRARDVRAPSRPADVTAILQAYASLKHNTVVVPELVSATAMVVVREVAAHNEWLYGHDAMVSQVSQPTASTLQPPRDGAGRSHISRTAHAWSLFLPPSLIRDLLVVYRDLGFYPGQALVTSVLLVLLPQLSVTPSAYLVDVLQVLADFAHHPGTQALSSFMAELHSRWTVGRQCTRRHLAAALYACASLGYAPGERFVQDACAAVLIGECGEEDSEEEEEEEMEEEAEGREEEVAGVASTGAQQHRAGSGASASSSETGSSSSSSSSKQQELFEPEEIVQVLWSLVVLQSVTIQRLGLGCMGLRHGSYLRRLNDVQLCAVAAASLAMQEEGPEMVEEVLPGEAVAQLGSGLLSYVRSWGDSVDNQYARQCFEALKYLASHQREALGSGQVVDAVQVLDRQVAVPGLLLPASGLAQLAGVITSDSSPEAEAHLQGDILVLVDVVARNELLSNGMLSGAALFRRRLLESLVVESAASSGAPLPQLVAAGLRGPGQARVLVMQLRPDQVRGADDVVLAAAIAAVAAQGQS